MGDTKIVQFNVDYATYVGDEKDGVYYQTARGPDGWYLTAVVDSDTGHFVDTLTEDDGPYETEERADMAGRDCAIEWCFTNNVSYEDEKE